MILHSLDPWLLARHVPNLERAAIRSLAHAGFEAWFPTYREIRPLPLRKIPPNKRNQAQWFVREVRVARFPGYLLIRPLPFCRWDVNRLAELRGCGSIVNVSGRAARIQDFDVELMRLAEANGTFDVHIGVGRRRYSITPEKNSNDVVAWTRGTKFPNIDGSGEFRLYVDALGRIARLVAQDEGHETGLSAQGVVSR